MWVANEELLHGECREDIEADAKLEHNADRTRKFLVNFTDL